MTCETFRQNLKADYDLVRVLSTKNDSLTVLLRHKTLSRHLVLRQYPEPVDAYDFLKTIRYENFPIIYDTYHLEDGQIVLEEYIDGITVASVLEDGLYTYEGARRVLLDVCDALALLHEQGFVHRDLKPENIMISKEGIVKLIDFNASRTYSDSASTDTVKIGTIGYAPPEQLGIAQSDRRTDIYALGILLNVMLTGKHPCKQLADGRVGKIIAKCTHINPTARYQTVQELAKDI